MSIQKVADGMHDVVQAEVKKTLQSDIVKYGHILQGAATPDLLKSEGGASLRKALLMKADKIDIEKIYEMKSNKTDTESMMDC